MKMPFSRRLLFSPRFFGDAASASFIPSSPAGPQFVFPLLGFFFVCPLSPLAHKQSLLLELEEPQKSYRKHARNENAGKRKVFVSGSLSLSLFFPPGHNAK